jgi:hypothetical protein
MVASLIFSSEWAQVTFQSPTPLRFCPVENNFERKPQWTSRNGAFIFTKMVNARLGHRF